LLEELSLQTRNSVRVPNSDATFNQLTKPSQLQARAHELIAQLQLE